MASIEGKRVKRNLLQAFNQVENNNNNEQLDRLAAKVAALRMANN
jgi:hypothetical protein